MPGGVALDSVGNLYILDTGNHRVQKFDPDGRFLHPSDGRARDRGISPIRIPSPSTFKI